MKRMQQPGSVLVLILMFCVGIMVMALVALRSGTVLLEMVHDRITWIKQMRATQALVYYGIADLRRRKHNRSFTSIIASWPPSEENSQGKVHAAACAKGYHITGILVREGRKQCVMQATIEQEKDQWTITHWKEGQKKKDDQYTWW